ncbi:hypothetical protein ACFSTC_43210 [Nonomuraea ferruginea]
MERATSEAVSSWVSMPGRRVTAVQLGQPSALSDSARPLTPAASGRRRSGVIALRSGTAVQVVPTLVAKRARNVSRGTINGPYVVNSPCSTPRLSNCSPTQRSPYGSASWKTPVTRTVTGLPSSRPRTVISCPLSNPEADAADSGIAASTAPSSAGSGHVPDTSRAYPSRPS